MGQPLEALPSRDRRGSLLMGIMNVDEFEPRTVDKTAAVNPEALWKVENLRKMHR